MNIHERKAFRIVDDTFGSTTHSTVKFHELEVNTGLCL